MNDARVTTGEGRTSITPTFCLKERDLLLLMEEGDAKCFLPFLPFSSSRELIEEKRSWNAASSATGKRERKGLLCVFRQTTNVGGPITRDMPLLLTVAQGKPFKREVYFLVQLETPLSQILEGALQLWRSSLFSRKPFFFLLLLTSEIV